MTLLDKETFFSSLGFLAILLKGQDEDKSASEKANVIGGLIEAFCHDRQKQMTSSSSSIALRIAWLLDRIIASIKMQMKAGQSAVLPESEELKTEMLDRLQYRQRLYMGDVLKSKKLMDVAIVNLLEQEIENVENDAKLTIVDIEGDPHAFASYEHLATAIANTLRKKGKCFKADLEAVGFTQQELEGWNMAYALAHVDLMEE